MTSIYYNTILWTQRLNEYGNHRLFLMKHLKILSQSRGPQAIQVAATKAVAQLIQIIVKLLRTHSKTSYSKYSLNCRRNLGGRSIVLDYVFTNYVYLTQVLVPPNTMGPDPQISQNNSNTDPRQKWDAKHWLWNKRCILRRDQTKAKQLTNKFNKLDELNVSVMRDEVSI